MCTYLCLDPHCPLSQNGTRAFNRSRRAGTLDKGFSGADLQALMYNAHLESVHSALERSEMTATSANSDDLPIRFVMLESNENTLSRAEQSALNTRVRCEYQLPDFYSPRWQIEQIVRGTQSKPTTIKVEAQSQKVRSSWLPWYVVLMTKLQVRISMANIRKALDVTRPSVAPEERKRLERMLVAFALSLG
jgi:SpoVK/Ycf46/Vps4 family AAA+-type ATPase